MFSLMKRTILLLFSVVSIFSALVAAPIERSAALQLARQFLSQTQVSKYTRGSVSELETEPAYIAKDAMTGTSHFYVYNLSNDGGFVIVAADTRVKTILGYSFNGGFDEKNIPVNTREWLDEYSSQIAYAIQQIPEPATTPVVTRGTSLNSVVVGPLLGDIQYNQDAPYNNLCPMDGLRRSVTGCVATAMAQVMRYHQHPVKGVGTKSYTTRTLKLELEVNFSATTYDWANILPKKYDSSATEEQKTAVATLMYHAGVAAEMDYTADGSGAYMHDAALGMYNHFSYDIGISLATRHYYSEEEWLQLIKTELNATRPVIMTGRNEEGGHAFVCDGYDTDDLVHINWGWGGAYDGFFEVSALNPGGSGIGGGDGGYNSNQSVCYGIQTPVGGSVPNRILGIDEITVDKSSISGGETARFNLSDVTGMSLFGFNGQLALALYDDAGNFVKIIKIYGEDITLDYGWYYESLSFTNIGVSDIRPDGSAVGIYYIKPVCRAQGEDTWKLTLVENGNVSKIPAFITDSGVSFTIPNYLIGVSANPTAGGTVTGGGSFAYGTSSTVTATANTGYTFTNWTENGTVVSTEPSYTFTVEKERSLVANFTANKYEVTFVASANGTLKVFHGETEIESGALIEYGTNLRVEALPDPEYMLVSLQANGQDVINNTVTVRGATEIVAVFGEMQYYTVSFMQPTNGTLKVLNGEIEIESGTEVAHGTVLRVEALPDSAYMLVSLRANGEDVINNMVTVTGPTEIVAVFDKQQYAVTFAQPTNGTLKLFDGETEIESGTEVEHGTILRVEAVPDVGYKLISLQANGEDIINDAVTVTGPTEIVALFGKQQYAVTFAQPTNGTLKVFHGETEIESGTEVGHGTILRVEAVPSDDYNLVSLQANGQAIINNTVTVTGPMEIVAVFGKQQNAVNFTQPANGTLKVFHGETEIESGTQVANGTKLRVEALPDTGYKLVSLRANGQDVINDTVTVTGPTEIVAVFGKQQYAVNFTQPANGTLKVFHGETELQSGAQVEYETKLRVDALPDTGYKLVSLQANGQDVINDTVTVTGPMEIVAVFAKQQYAVNFAKPANGTLKVFHGETELQSGTLIEYETQLRVEALPDTGYKLVSLQANGQAITNDTVTVTGPTEIVAQFAKQQYAVNFTQPANGTLKVFHGKTELQTGALIEYETQLRVEAVPDTGYKLVSLQANGQAITNDTVTVTGPTDIVAQFAKQQYAVNFAKPANGTLKVFSGKTELQTGALIEYETQLRVEAVPDTGYKLGSLQANGQAITNDTVAVTGPTEIVAQFAKQQFPVNFTQPANGTLKVFHGETLLQTGALIEYETKLRVEAIPDMGYKLVSLQANGQAITNDTVTVTGPTEIKALFERWVSSDNYRIKVTNAGCPGSNDGKIEVSFAKQLDYTVTVKNDSGFEKTEKVTGTTYSLTDLAAGNYSVCFTIEGAINYKQCFEVVITQPQELSVFKSAVADNHATYRVSGGTRYTVTHNGRSMETTDDVIEVPLRRGRNVIRITAENECQGVFEDEVYHTDSQKLILFPNPTTGQFSIILPHGEEEVTVEIISILGHSVLKEKRRVSLDGLISMNISALPNGIYLVRVNGKIVKQVTKVIKK